jgi:hypothetical protein
MTRNWWAVLLLFLGTFLCGASLAQVKYQSRHLVVNGQAGKAQVVEIDGRLYVAIESLAQITNGSSRFEANRIVLTLPLSDGNAPTTTPPTNSGDEPGLSHDFMKASIEAMAGMREWASTLAYAIQNGYQVTEGWAATYREQAARNVNLASVAASTEADRNASQLVNNEFDAVRDWSNKLVEAKRSMDAGKYALSANALRDEPATQKIVNCGRFLASMLGSGTFQDDQSCH